jgi:hypothetical protein
MMTRAGPLLLTCALWIPSLAARTDPPVVITLERTACFGTCAVYSVQIDGDGHVVYDGRKFVRVTGHAEAQIAPDAVARLAAQFDRVGYFALKDTYDSIEMPDGRRGFVTDLPTTTTSIRIGSRVKRVVDYVGAPKALEELEREIDLVAGTMQWISVTAAVVRELQRTGWNAAGTDGAEYLEQAIERDDAETVDALVRAKADPNAGRWPMLLGAHTPAMIRRLVAAGADANAMTSNGNTVLMHAVRGGRADVVATLLEVGADTGARNASGDTALQIATRAANDPVPPPFPGTPEPPREYQRIIALLRAAGAK